MNVQITTRQQSLILDGLHARILMIEKLINTFKSIELIASYVKERQDLIELKKQIESLKKQNYELETTK